jgi:hypothetical protein
MIIANSNPKPENRLLLPVKLSHLAKVNPLPFGNLVQIPQSLTQSMKNPSPASSLSLENIESVDADKSVRPLSDLSAVVDVVVEVEKNVA